MKAPHKVILSIFIFVTCITPVFAQQHQTSQNQQPSFWQQAKTTASSAYNYVTSDPGRAFRCATSAPTTGKLGRYMKSQGFPKRYRVLNVVVNGVSVAYYVIDDFNKWRDEQ